MPISREHLDRTERFALGKLLERLNRSAKLGNPTQLDPWETEVVADIIRDWLWWNEEPVD